MSAHACSGRDLPLLLLDTLDSALFLTTHAGEETGMARIGKGKASKCGLEEAATYDNLFYAAMVAQGKRNVSRFVTLDTNHDDRAVEQAQLDRFYNDSATGRFEAYCATCGAFLRKVGYGPGLAALVPAFINISGALTATYAEARDEAGRAVLDLLALRLN
jgi:hypothetical protein